MNLENNRSMLFPWLAIVGLLVFLFFFPFPQHNAFWALLQDTGHFPLFGVISILLLFIFLRAFRQHGTSRRAAYLASFLSTLFIAALVEMAQSFIPDREASVNDFYLGAAGGLCFLLGFSLFDNALNLATTQLRKLLVGATSLSLLLTGTLPLVSLTVDYLSKQQAFPTLLTFEQSWPRPFLSIHKNEQLPSERAQQTNSTPAGYLHFMPDANAQWPFIRLDEVTADWRQYHSIQFDFISNANEPMPITLLLDDQHTRTAGQHSQHYRRTLAPGLNRITLPLSAVASSQSLKTMDLEHMASIWIAFPNPRPASAVLIGEIRLR